MTEKIELNDSNIFDPKPFDYDVSFEPSNFFECFWSSEEYRNLINNLKEKINQLSVMQDNYESYDWIRLDQVNELIDKILLIKYKENNNTTKEFT